MRSADDLTAVARIRDAAIDQVGRHGFTVGLRAIAQAAGVSAALVIHHFGSKEGLLKACDEYVAEEIRKAKRESLTSAADPRGSNCCEWRYFVQTPIFHASTRPTMC